MGCFEPGDMVDGERRSGGLARAAGIDPVQRPGSRAALVGHGTGPDPAAAVGLQVVEPVAREVGLDRYEGPELPGVPVQQGQAVGRADDWSAVLVDQHSAGLAVGGPRCVRAGGRVGATLSRARQVQSERRLAKSLAGGTAFRSRSRYASCSLGSPCASAY